MKGAEKWQSPRGLRLIRGWVREGLSEEAIAERMGIRVGTLRAWQNKHSALAEAMDHTMDYQVEDALLKKALGYENVERRVEVSAKGERKEVETIKQVGPDMSAISMWLKKRRPEQWGDGREEGHPPENNLLERLEEAGKGETDAIPELQSQTAAGDDLVEAETVPGV